MEKKLWIVVHTHRFGTSTYLVRAKRCPSIKRVVKKCEIDYEPDREESIEIDPAGEPVEM